MPTVLRGRIILLGSPLTGKTVFLNGHSGDYIPTVNVSSSLKSVSLPSEHKYKFEFIMQDTPGSDIYASYLDSLTDNPCFVLLFIDTSNRKSFERVKTMLESLPSHCHVSVVTSRHSDENKVLEKDIKKWIEDRSLTSFHLNNSEDDTLTSVLSSVLSKSAAQLLDLYKN
ncbi:hypothetical protein GEMRC1_010216 [Eukaryota sp. GEM-RC1]